MEALASHRSNGQIIPIPSMEVAKVELRGIPIAVVKVEPSDLPPVRYKMQTWIRVGPSARLATQGMFRELGHAVLAMDLDPQSNLTSAFLDESDLEHIWPEGDHTETILGAIDPLIQSLGDIRQPVVRRIDEKLYLVPGELGLSLFEDRLSEAWAKCLDDNTANAGDGFRVMTAFYRVMKAAGDAENIDVALIDVGPNVGAMNRAALVAADLFSLQGLRNLGPTLSAWRSGWNKRKEGRVPKNLAIPGGSIEPVGMYFSILQFAAIAPSRPA